ncbi:MAG TPA: BrnA antitoxin family protein [Sphingobium sp.]|uniref:BrnA antitoxin family protein n=1 Tax=Sphingobium sp. TaxID=1912891 RepID=UPI002ED3DCE7
MNEENITTNWVDPDDAPKLDRTWFAEAELRDGDRVIRRGRPRSENAKQAVSLRLDADVLDWFKKDGTGWQTRMNDALRKVAGI